MPGVAITKGGKWQWRLKRKAVVRPFDYFVLRGVLRGLRRRATAVHSGGSLVFRVRFGFGGAGFCGSLVLLHVLLLGGVFLFELLGLLGVALFLLLLLGVVVVFCGGLLVLGFLLLLEFLVILGLPGCELLLLLLILLIGGGFAGIGRRERVRLQGAGVIGARGCGLC